MSFSTSTHMLIFCFLMIFSELSNGQLVQDRQSLDSQQYHCFNEELVFTCSAPGTAIQWDAPPVFIGEGFLDIQTVPRSRNISGLNGTVYLQQGMPTFVTTLRIRNVRDITVQCSTNAPFSSSLSLTTSTTPSPVENVKLDILDNPKRTDISDPSNITISWIPLNETFDLRHYRVQLCIDVECTNMNTTSSSVTVERIVSDNDVVYALVSAESRCGDVGRQSSSAGATVQLLTFTIFQNDLTAVIILAVFCAALGILLLLISGALCFVIIFYRDVIRKRSTHTEEEIDVIKLNTES